MSFTFKLCSCISVNVHHICSRSSMCHCVSENMYMFVFISYFIFIIIVYLLHVLIYAITTCNVSEFQVFEIENYIKKRQKIIKILKIYCLDMAFPLTPYPVKSCFTIVSVSP